MQRKQWSHYNQHVWVETQSQASPWKHTQQYCVCIRTVIGTQSTIAGDIVSPQQLHSIATFNSTVHAGLFYGLLIVHALRAVKLILPQK